MFESYSTEMKEVLQRYCIFNQDTEQGLNDKTAKFWIQYVLYLIHLYHNFTRSVRAGDFDCMFLACLKSLTYFCKESFDLYEEYYNSLKQLPEHP